MGVTPPCENESAPAPADTGRERDHPRWSGGDVAKCTGCGVKCDPRSPLCRSCGTKAQWANGKIANRTPRVTGSCPECDEDVVYSGFGAPKKYCSDKCNKRVQNRRTRRRIKMVNLDERPCGECGEMFKPRRVDGVYCSPVCYRAGKVKRPKFTPEMRSCDECGAEFTARRHDARFCRAKCAFAFHSRARANRARTGGPAPYVDRDIFERDGWTCWLCNESVNQALPRTDRRGATIDHVIPLARGGADTPENVRLAHWECNHAKHTRIVA